MSDIPAIKILLDLKVGMKNRALYKEMHENSFYTTKGESAKYWYKDNYKLIDRYINVIIKISRISQYWSTRLLYYRL